MDSAHLIRRAGGRLALALAIAAVFALATPAAAITYGAIDTEHTYVGAMIVDYPGYGVTEWCTGTLVSTRVFLTAGHCTFDLSDIGITLDKVWVSFAVDVYAKGAKWHTVSAVITHPDYHWGPTSDPHDVAALVLTKPVRGVGLGQIAPLGYLDALDDAGVLADATFINVGYGVDQNFQGDGVRRISYSSFLSLHRAWLYMSQNVNAGSAGTCFGDSGGPTLYDDHGTQYVVAIVSWGDAMCVATNINYRMDTSSSQSFLYGVIAAYG